MRAEDAGEFAAWRFASHQLDSLEIAGERVFDIAVDLQGWVAAQVSGLGGAHVHLGTICAGPALRVLDAIPDVECTLEVVACLGEA